MPDRDVSPGAEVASAPHVILSERERQFGDVLRVLMQWQQFYVALTETYLVAPLADRMKLLDGVGLHPNTLRSYLRGESLPSDATARLLADALGVPRGVLLYAADYLTLDDLPHYPGPYATLETVEEDTHEIEALPLEAMTRERITADLRVSARILRLLNAERMEADWRTMPDERQEVLNLLIELWETPIPPPPPLTAHDQQLAEAWAAAETTHDAAPALVAAPTVAPQAAAETSVEQASEALRPLH